MATNTKTIAIINASSPTQACAKEGLDTALIYGAYEQSISLFYIGEGVRQLVSNQYLDDINIKDFLKTMSAFEFYEIENVYVCKQSLAERSLDAKFHIDNVQILSPELFSEKLHQHNVILRF
jgi:tRNA 2-thiouridine synthesizing protein C